MRTQAIYGGDVKGHHKSRLLFGDGHNIEGRKKKNTKFLYPVWFLHCRNILLHFISTNYPPLKLLYNSRNRL